MPPTSRNQATQTYERWGPERRQTHTSYPAPNANTTLSFSPQLFPLAKLLPDVSSYHFDRLGIFSNVASMWSHSTTPRPVTASR
ncbi:hypothetical protein Cob_v000531 [Colletotrichum orbiculare MAFF 240422]|uniref:Uncharacterized protein n=1 Tax=Colletotrichum orbiculare (strain 104-T / ATCC 96160 / CBS 514.97 / LARS 414 / MAFF 240422) TaxID=1213857 RepID=A0A484G6U8_COLOR|nr:hypothetical protein Cob_v000531 [Colletotrichum orbiculare MAFF 240422]